MALNTRRGLRRNAGPFRWLWDQVKQVYKKLRGKRTEQKVRPQVAHRDRYLAEKGRKGGSNTLVERLFAGEMNHQQWTLEARQEIKKTFIAQYVVGHGGRESMTQADWGRLGSMLKGQYGYLRGFEQDLIAGKLSEGQAKTRLQMYFNASRQAYEQGRAYARGVLRLPAYPGDGTTVCLSNCQCTWEIEETVNEWLANWTLGAAEHCPDCLDRADKWAPYRQAKVPVLRL